MRVVGSREDEAGEGGDPGLGKGPGDDVTGGEYEDIAIPNTCIWVFQLG